ncbi:unnamed protein product [Sphagnum balticum]
MGEKNFLFPAQGYEFKESSIKEATGCTAITVEQSGFHCLQLHVGDCSVAACTCPMQRSQKTGTSMVSLPLIYMYNDHFLALQNFQLLSFQYTGMYE